MPTSSKQLVSDKELYQNWQKVETNRYWEGYEQELKARTDQIIDTKRPDLVRY
jgi:hypothetical protein